MIRVDRAPESEPAVLHEKFASDGLSELERVRAHRNGPDKHKSFEFARYKAAAVKTALDRLFHGKCAYCESFYAKTQPVDVEHYRPKGEVEGTDHPGYWWLGMDWLNLVPSCIDCNRRRAQRTPDPAGGSMIRLTEEGDFVRGRQLSTGKASAFPLEGNSPRARDEGDDLALERRLLLDPTRDDPDLHLVFHVDRAHPIALVYPRPIDPEQAPVLPAAGNAAAVAIAAGAAGVSAIGAVSIQTYGLNRLSLVQARTRALRDLEFLLELSIGLTEIVAELDDRIRARVPTVKTVSRRTADRRRAENALDRRICEKIRVYQNRTLGQIKAACEPTAPYAALARAWIKAYVADEDQPT